ncbi:MAG: SusC/RagA family TonB-linked outer membrane protein, partial [Gemmatimonadota bacterium]
MRWLLSLIAAGSLVIAADPAPAWAQGDVGTITGRITAIETGEPISGVSVHVQDTDRAALTDEEGRYLIVGVPVGTHTVAISVIGYADETIEGVEVERDASVVLNVELTSQAIELEEIVAIGYGTQQRQEITSAVASAMSDDFIAGPARDAASLIAGQLPGLIVTTPTGDPTEGTEINLRGVTTISGDTDPLVLVDGVPADLETVAAEDIESISVLKDGSAGAIYGSRASNGVILITTKQHDGADPRIRYSGYASRQTLYRTPEFLSADDFRRLESEGMGSSFIQDMTDGQVSTNWIDEVLREPASYRHNLSISGGTPTTHYTASLDYEDTQGIFLRSDNRETTGRVNIGHTMFDGRLSADVNLVLGERKFFDGAPYDYAWRQALIRNPTDRIHDEAGEWQERGGYFYSNPLRLIQEVNGTYEEQTARLHGNITLNPVDNVRLSLLAGTSRGSVLTGFAETFGSPDGPEADASRYTNSDVDRLIQFTSSYSNDLGAHSVSVLGGYDYQDFTFEWFSASNSEFPTDQYLWHQLGDGDALGDGRADIGSGISDYKVVGFFGRLNYDWNNRYLLTGTVRYEGNSRFGANHKWGWFPSVSAGWRISDEAFMAGVDFVDDLKLRAGYGITGIAPEFSYLSLASFSYGSRFYNNGRWIQTLGPSRNANPELRWERKDEINVGADFAMLGNRLFGTVDVYERNTRDMLYNYDVPSPPFPVGSILANVGHMRNRGVEAMLSYDGLRSGGLSWTTSVNGSTNSNRLVSLSNDVYVTDDCFMAGYTGEPIQQATHRVCVGDEIGNFYGYRSIDITEDGEWIVADSTGSPIPISDAGGEDRHVLGNGIPKYHLAWNNEARFGDFDLNVNMRGAFEFQILNFQRLFYENPT